MMNIVFGNKEQKIIINPENGRLESASFGGRDIPLKGKLWNIRTSDGNITIDDMTEFWYEEHPRATKLFWKSDRAYVVVNLKTDADNKIRMNINAEVFGKSRLFDVRFPVVEGLSFPDDNYLLITWQNGRILKNAVDSFLSKGHDVPFWVGRGKYGYQNEYPAALSFQYTTFYNKDYGYYFATEDSDVYIKTYSFDYNKEENAMDFSVVNYPENMGKTNSYCMNYDFVLKIYEGDWQTATQMYRNWATNQKWCKTKLCDKKLPDNLIKTDLWRINHTNYELGTRTEEYFDSSVKLKKLLGCNLANHWYGWNMGVHGVNYPEYISGQRRLEGWVEKLKDWNKKFDEEGIVKIPFINARLWEKKCESWKTENAYDYAVKDENGELPLEPWGESLGFELKAVCPATSMWQNKVEELAKEYCVEDGFDGIYLDQIASYNATLCFDETHPHPLGGGTWWNDSYHRMVENVRDIVGSERIITTESCCETYVDLFDIFLVLDTCFQNGAFNAMSGGEAVSVPLFNLIYGDYALSYGSICCFSDRVDQFEYNLIRNTVWGFLPTVEGLDMAEIDSGTEYIEITKRVVDFYKENKDIFLYGRLLSIPEYDSDILAIEWEARDEARNVYKFDKSFKAVCASLWETKNGETMLFAYNYANEKKIIEIDGNKYEINPKSFCSKKI